jgi:hypothetical protein
MVGALILAILIAFCLSACVTENDAGSMPRVATAPVATGPSEGAVRLFTAAPSSFDHWTRQRRCGRFYRRYHRVIFYPPFADRCAGHYPNGLGYVNAQAIYRRPATPGSNISTSLHRRAGRDRRILRDAQGRPLYVPYGCRRGSCPQYAADIGSSVWRRHLHNAIHDWIGKGYRGIFLDDVNWNLNASDSSGRPVRPIDPRTGQIMRVADWKRYMARLIRSVARTFPTAELMLNSVWWRGSDNPSDPVVARGLAAATHYEIERGVADVRRGQPYDALLTAIDRIHALGLSVNVDGYQSTTRADAELELATYLLISNGHDSVHADYGSCPTARPPSPCEERFWRGWHTDLGRAESPRTKTGAMYLRRFERGLVLLNAPRARRMTVLVPDGYHDLDGRDRSGTVALDGGEALVLHRRPSADPND